MHLHTYANATSRQKSHTHCICSALSTSVQGTQAQRLHPVHWIQSSYDKSYLIEQIKQVVWSLLAQGTSNSFGLTRIFFFVCLLFISSSFCFDGEDVNTFEWLNIVTSCATGSNNSHQLTSLCTDNLSHRAFTWFGQYFAWCLNSCYSSLIHVPGTCFAWKLCFSKRSL